MSMIVYRATATLDYYIFIFTFIFPIHIQWKKAEINYKADILCFKPEYDQSISNSFCWAVTFQINFSIVRSLYSCWKHRNTLKNSSQDKKHWENGYDLPQNLHYKCCKSLWEQRPLIRGRGWGNHCWLQLEPTKAGCCLRQAYFWYRPKSLSFVIISAKLSIIQKWVFNILIHCWVFCFTCISL